MAKAYNELDLPIVVLYWVPWGTDAKTFRDDAEVTPTIHSRDCGHFKGGNIKYYTSLMRFFESREAADNSVKEGWIMPFAECGSHCIKP
jgi:hypothetical protein